MRTVLAALMAGTVVLAADPGRAERPHASNGLEAWLDATTAQLTALAAATDEELSRTGVQRLLRVYLDAYEPIENWYGPGAPYGVEPLATLVMRGETRFHAALQARGPAALRSAMTALHEEVRAVREAALRAGVPLVPDAAAAVALGDVQSAAPPRGLRTPEIRGIVEALSVAQTEFRAGRSAAALQGVEQAYLQQFEPIEARLAGPVTRRVESLIHIRLRPLLARGAPASDVDPVFGALYAALEEADASLAAGSSFWFGAANAFAIIMREGLEAVLLIAAMLAYLTGIGAQRVHRQRIWAGAAGGVAASFGTWWLARTLLPVSGANREILEGVTALVAVAVLVYVSHWLFQKTYIHDWKNYLRTRMGTALTTGSALAMAGLAFAAVYREGFETVLFYQALLYDSSSTAVLAGFVPGVLIITAIGAAILRLGAKLPLRQLFAVTNTILLWLAFVFLGKGIYNLQEAGLFAPHPLAWMPDNEVLRQLLGMYPLVETLLAQLAFLTGLLAMYVYYRRRIVPASATRSPAEERTPAAAS